MCVCCCSNAVHCSHSRSALDCHIHRNWHSWRATQVDRIRWLSARFCHFQHRCERYHLSNREWRRRREKRTLVTLSNPNNNIDNTATQIHTVCDFNNKFDRRLCGQNGRHENLLQWIHITFFTPDQNPCKRIHVKDTRSEREREKTKSYLIEITWLFTVCCSTRA